MLACTPAAQAKGLADWSDILNVAVGTKAIVLLFKDATPRGARKIKSVFGSATADSATVLVPNGLTRTLAKKSVRVGLIRRPWSKRYPGWLVLGGGTSFARVIVEGL